ncbi:MAG: MerR family transcriptional regulator [Deltaproteobacteria bacterium]|nr:MerR family transcriptional regulator [Deltaproteobacteria bacterium]
MEHNAADRPFRIGEAAKLVGVEAYVLRFWETQFSFIRPKQSHSLHRYYTQADVETLKIVKRLLHTEGYTIAGARKFIREKGLDRIRGPAMAPERVASDRKTKEQPAAASVTSSSEALVSTTTNGVHRALREIREDLRALHKLLDTR